jgi:hypothetical protein
LRRVLVDRGRAIIAQGEAIYAGMLIGALLPILVSQRTVGSDLIDLLIDGALLALEKRRLPMNEGDPYQPVEGLTLQPADDGLVSY